MADKNRIQFFPFSLSSEAAVVQWFWNFISGIVATIRDTLEVSLSLNSAQMC